MSHADRERWDAKYAAGNPNPTFAPDPLLSKYADLLRGPGWALDLACGVGHNAIFLARRGYDVLAVDVSLTALRHCQTALASAPLPVYPVAADLDRFALIPGSFALVIVFRFLDRTLVPRLKEALAPGGIMLYETFNTNRLRTDPRMNRAYLLEPGDLARAFADFHTIATNDCLYVQDEQSYWIGRRPDK
ncbi:MAG: class I SAM-dependent methyltransferase [Sulfurifustaceae bacterium]